MCRAEGIIKNVNTIEEFKNADRAGMVNRCAQTVSSLFWVDVDSSSTN